MGLGAGAAYAYSVVATLAPGIFPESFRVEGHVAVYFEAATVIISLTLFGQEAEIPVAVTRIRAAARTRGHQRVDPQSPVRDIR